MNFGFDVNEIGRRKKGRSEGLVIFFDLTLTEEARAIVLDLDILHEDESKVLRQISRKAFELTESLCYDVISNKNLQRRLDKPLIPGQMVSWKEEHVDMHGAIQRFERIPSIYESRDRGGFGQILLEGAVNPKRPYDFYTGLLGYIPMSREAFDEPAPDVYLKAWITLKFEVEDNNYLLVEEFDSFHSVCSSGKQLDSALLPWNIDSSEKCVVSAYLLPDSDDEVALEKQCYAEKEREYEIKGAEAYMTGDRALLLSEYTEDKCFLPLRLSSMYWTIGEKYKVDCFWEDNSEAYYVTNATRLGQDKWPTDTKSLLLTTEVVAHRAYRGVYYSDTYGIMDDPTEELTFFHLTKQYEHPILVTIIDNFPSRHRQFRFSIQHIIDERSTYKEDIKNLKVCDVVGIVIPDGVFAAEHSPIVFEFTSKDKPPLIGFKVKFNAKYDYTNEVFFITEWNIIPEESVRVLKRRFKSIKGASKHRQHIYSVRVEVVSVIPNSVDMLYSKDFGLIDDCLDIVPVTDKQYYNVWIKEKTATEKFVYPPRTPFFVVAVGENYPEHIKGTKDKKIKVDDIITASTTPEDNSDAKYNNTYINNAETTVIEPSVKSEISSASNTNPLPVDSNSSPKISPDDSPPQRFSPYHQDRYFGFAYAPSYHDNNAPSYQHGFGQQREEIQEYFKKPSPFVNNQENSEQTSDEEDVNSDDDSLFTDQGGIDPVRSSFRKSISNIERYDGPVLKPAGSDRKFDVVETFSRLKASVKHDNCGNRCTAYCSWVSEVAKLVLNKQFREEMDKYHKPISDAVRLSLQNADE